MDCIIIILRIVVAIYRGGGFVGSLLMHIYTQVYDPLLPMHYIETVLTSPFIL